MDTNADAVSNTAPIDPNEQYRQYQDALQRVRDEEHLKLLVIGYWIVGIMTIVYASFFILYIFMGAVFVHMPAPPVPAPRPGAMPAPDPFPPAFGYIFIVVGVACVIIGWTIGILTLQAARCLMRRRNTLFIQVIAGLQCLNMPFGTLVGVSTFIVLSRPSVRELFGTN